MITMTVWRAMCLHATHVYCHVRRICPAQVNTVANIFNYNDVILQLTDF